MSQIRTFPRFMLLAATHNLTLVFPARIIDWLASPMRPHTFAPLARNQTLGMTSGSIRTGLLVGPASSAFPLQFGSTVPVWAATDRILAMIVLLPPSQLASYMLHAPELKTRAVLRTRYAWNLLGLLTVFFVVNPIFYIRPRSDFQRGSVGWGNPFGLGKTGGIFACASIIVQRLLITHADRIMPDRRMVKFASTSLT